MDTQALADAKNKQDVMVSNLPLLFSNGKPTSLSSMDAQDLQYFIPFLVKCILGCEASGWAKYPKFKWWPEDVPWSSIILTRKHQTPNWRNKLESVVRRCYEHNGCSYLLQFSARLEQLSGFKFEDNWDGTTSMYDIKSGKLLVTFRNENMNYDRSFRQQDAASRPTLLPRLNSPTSPTKLGIGTPTPHVASQAPPIAKMVEPPATDLYLCDYCGADFSTLSAIKGHEVKCMAEKASVVQSNINHALEEDTEEVDEAKFLWYLRLLGRNETGPPPNATPAKKYPTIKKPCTLIAKRFTTIPFSSNLGQSFFRTRGMAPTQAEHLVSRYERLCVPKPVVASVDQAAQPSVSSAASSRPRSAQQKRKDEWVHKYSFTKADRRERMITIATGLDKQARKLLRNCTPSKVVLNRLSADEIEKWTRPKPKRVQPLIQPWLQKSIANLPSSCTVSLAPADSPQTWLRKKPMTPQIVLTRLESASQSNGRSQTAKRPNEPPPLLPLITNAWSMQTMQSVKPRPVNNQFVLPDLIPVVNRQPKIRSPEPVVINMPSLQKPKTVIDSDTPSVTITPSTRGIELVDLCSSEDESDDEVGTVINTGVDKPLVLPPGISVTKIDRSPSATNTSRAKSSNLMKPSEQNNNRSKHPVHTSTPMLPKGPPPALKFMGNSSVKREFLSENPTIFISDDVSLQTVTPLRIGKMSAEKREQMKQSLRKIKKKEAKTSPVGTDSTTTNSTAQSVKENQATPSSVAPRNLKGPRKDVVVASLAESKGPKRSVQSKILNSSQVPAGRKRSAESDHDSEESGDRSVGPPTKKVPRLDVDVQPAEENGSKNQPNGEACPSYVEADASSSDADTRGSSRSSWFGSPDVRNGRKRNELSLLLDDECKELRRKGLETLPGVELPNQRVTRCRTKSLPSASNNKF